MVLNTNRKLIQIDENNKVSYIGAVSSSSKIRKNEKLGVATYSIYFAPHNLAGEGNMCTHSTKECRALCLYGSGRNKFDTRIDKARKAKTIMYWKQPERMGNIVVREITNAQKLWTKKGFEFSCRINATSDVDVTNFCGKNLLELFPTITWYDYTKNASRFEISKKYSNYHLTYSFSGFEKDWVKCKQFLDNGQNVSVVFEKTLPETYRGYEVVNGDLSDVRFMDKKGVIVGLVFKKLKGNPDVSNSKFIIKNH